MSVIATVTTSIAKAVDPSTHSTGLPTTEAAEALLNTHDASCASEACLQSEYSASKPLPSLEEIQQIQQELRELSASEPADRQRRVYPSITISNPTGYGADQGQVFAGIGFQSRTRFSGGENVGTIFWGR